MKDFRRMITGKSKLVLHERNRTLWTSRTEETRGSMLVGFADKKTLKRIYPRQVNRQQHSQIGEALPVEPGQNRFQHLVE